MSESVRLSYFTPKVYIPSTFPLNLSMLYRLLLLYGRQLFLFLLWTSLDPPFSLLFSFVGMLFWCWINHGASLISIQTSILNILYYNPSRQYLVSSVQIGLLMILFLTSFLLESHGIPPVSVLWPHQWYDSCLCSKHVSCTLTHFFLLFLLWMFLFLYLLWIFRPFLYSWWMINIISL